MGVIEENLREIESRIAGACHAYNRRVDEITLVGVSKTVGVDSIREGINAGLTHLGENKIQEAEKKIPAIGTGPIWHMIGHLQSNKVKKAVQLFDIIESVDSIKLAETISKECVKQEITMKVLLEVNSSGEESKYGAEPELIPELAEKVNMLENIELCGLMTVGPLTDDAETIVRAFELTHTLFRRLQDQYGDKISTLSMGMTGDFEQAIKFGSTELRIGTAIFGARNY